MWLAKEAFGWIILAGLAAGLLSTAMSYRVLRGRRQNLMVHSLKRGLIGGALVSALLLSILLLAAWLRS
jgi:hypothetical protein